MTRALVVRDALSSEPGVLRLVALLVLALAGIAGVTANLALERFKGTVRTIAQDSAPSVILAGGIRESLASMDAHAVNGFLPGAPKEAYAEFEDHKDRLVNQLVQASGNVTYGESELTPLRALFSGLASYTGYAKAADMMGHPAGIAAQLKASQLLHQQLLPAGEELDRANFGPMQASARYAVDHDFSTGLKVSGWLLVALLAALQVTLAVRFRRVFNPALLVAFLLMIAVLWRLDRDLTATQTLVREAVEMAFASVHAVSKAKALAHDSNGDESLYLLVSGDRASQAQYEESFKLKVGHLFSAPVTARVRDQFATSVERGEKSPYDGYLADALNNVVFPGEDKLALAALDSLKRYLEIDQRIRDLEQSGQHAKAVELALGSNPGQSNYAFAELDDALTALSKLNEREFDRRISEAQAHLRSDEIFATAAIGLVALLAFVGLKARINEFA